jgi:hypothetical protein
MEENVTSSEAECTEMKFLQAVQWHNFTIISEIMLFSQTQVTFQIQGRLSSIPQQQDWPLPITEI